MKLQKISFHIKKLFVFILLSVFSVLGSTIVTLVPLIGNMNKNSSNILSFIGLILILLIGFWIIKKFDLQKSGELLKKKFYFVY